MAALPGIEKKVLLHFMKVMPKHDTINKWQLFFGIIAILCIILSFCPVKSGVKDLLGLQETTGQQRGNKPNKVFTGNFAAYCSYNLVIDIDETVIQKSGLKLSENVPACLHDTVFSLTYGPDTFRGHHEHPRYNSSQIPGLIPLFIRDRKLII